MELKCKGSTLFEVLITILITSFCLLGLAGLQIRALNYIKTASIQSEAMQLAYDISERMRANSAGVQNNAYLYQTAYSETIHSKVQIPLCDRPCKPEIIASIDVAEWIFNLSQNLPGGAGYIVTDASGRTFVTLMWQEAGLETDSSCPQEVKLNPGSGIRCYQISFTT